MSEIKKTRRFILRFMIFFVLSVSVFANHETSFEFTLESFYSSTPISVPDENIPAIDFQSMTGTTFIAQNPGTYLLRISINTVDHIEHALFLKFAAPDVDQIEVFSVHNEQLHSVGDRFPYDSRPVPTLGYVLPLENVADLNTLIVKLQVSSPTVIPVSIQSQANFDETHYKVYALLGFLCAILAFSLFMWVAIRQKLYFWLFSIALGASTLFSHNCGALFKFLLGGFPLFQQSLGELSAMLILVASVKFILASTFRSMLESRWANYGLALLTAVFLMLTYFSNSVFYPLCVAVLLVFLFGAATSWLAVLHRKPEAWFYCIAWSTLSSMVALSLAQFIFQFAFFSLGWFVPSLVSVFALTILSFALAYRNIRFSIMRDGEQLARIEALQEEQESQRSELVMERASNAAKNVFLQLVSQNVKNPLHTFYGNIQLLSTSDLDKEQKEKIESARENAIKLFFHMENLLTYTEILRGDIIPIESKANVEDEIIEVVDAWQRNMDSNDTLVTAMFDENLPTTLFAEWVHVRKVLRVLFDSVIDKVSAQHCDLFVSSKLQGAEGALSIRFDNILGISKKQLDNWVKDSIHADEWEGLGLEYFVGRKLIEVLGARLSYQEVDENVYSILFEFPCRIAKDEYASSPRISFPNVKILVVDDNGVNLQVMTAMLSRLGVTSDIASSGEDAIEYVKQADYDLILMDCLMPGLSGQQTTMKIRELVSSNQNTPIIAVSANSSDKDRESCLNAGMNDFMSKPVRIDKVAKFLSRWVPEY